MGKEASIDPDKVHHLVHTNPLGKAFSRLDHQLAAADESATFELAEDTYSWLRTLSPLELADTTTTQATFYIDRALTDLQESAPDSDFCTLPTDDDYNAHELVYPAVTLRLKFNTTHEASTPITTEFSAITIATPTLHAYLQRTQDTLNDLE